jgi:broad specificity phosphatase PhoE
LTIILVRHGETVLNANRVLQFPDTPLGERGLAQAQAVARRLALMRPAALLASDMSRAWMTAQAIAVATGLPIHPSQLLHERSFGDLRGRAYDELDHDPVSAEEGPPNGESMPVFRARVAQAFDEMLKLRATLAGPLVVVSHGLVIKVILADLVLRPAGVAAPERLGNTSISIFAPEPPYRVELIDSTTHLDEGNADNKLAVAGV